MAVTGSFDYVALHAQLQPAACAARDLTTGARWTYREFDQAASQFAALLLRRGIRKGDRVASLAKNRAELILLHLGCARIGAIYVPLNWRLAPAEIAGVMADAEPSLLLGDSSLDQTKLQGISLDEFATEASAERPMLLDLPDAGAPSLILYTSGTSGRPKGVLLSDQNIWQTALNFSVLGRVTHTSVMLCDSPMFHVIGLIANIQPLLMRGGSFMVSDGFKASRTLERLSDPALGITHYFCVPQMAAMLRADLAFDPAKLRGLTAIFCGGAPHSARAIRAWCKDGIPIANGFGMSEAGTVSLMPPDIAAIEARAGAAGVIPPDMQAQIRHDDGRECEAGEAGELFIKGTNISCGYWRQPEATRDAFDKEGWFRTGDVAYFDDAGYLWLIDRKKDMYISGGENVYPAEIESVLAGYPGVAECAVVGVSDDRWGEVGHLALVPQANADIDFAKIVRFLEMHVAHYKLPKHFSRVSELPRNGTGKVMKETLRTMLTTRDGA